LLTNREGRRPERTIYQLTPAGAGELETWVRHLLDEPAREYPRFGAALMFLGALRHKDEAIRVLQRRAAVYEAEIGNDARMGQVPSDLPRFFTIQEEYGQAMRRAELDWIRRTIVELQDGSLEWPEMLEHQPPMR
ncbi:MAG TPA: PadR family transcriptional regulator, partial [Verrucomicrobiae bacterium]|nr:PadR family transcriptional regulator [Verrucomicrobiae bacterium]